MIQINSYGISTNMKYLKYYIQNQISIDLESNNSYYKEDLFIDTIWHIYNYSINSTILGHYLMQSREFLIFPNNPLQRY